MKTARFTLPFLLIAASAWAQPVQDSTLQVRRDVPISEQRDLLDVAGRLLPFLKLKQSDTTILPIGRTFVWVVPAFGYSQQTGALGQIQGNIAYRRPNANVSTIIPAVAYTQNQQLFFANRMNLWTRDNRYNLVGDYRLFKYPQDTYGLGTATLPSDQLLIDFTWLRVHQTVLKRIGRNLYTGVGYNLDLHWNINTSREEAPVTIPNYSTGTTGRSVSSGIALQLLYDSRVNSLNPDPSSYASLVVRTNLRALGSDQNYQTLTADVRRYLYVPSRSSGILALWAYGVFTVGENPPYLDLPYTASDLYQSSGRGYIQGRFRGRNFLYQEAEYRFPITRNRLISGVAFVNNQLATNPVTQRFGPFTPGAGVGVRLLSNKFSRLNIAIDYGFGLKGSQGFFFNFGEFF